MKNFTLVAALALVACSTPAADSGALQATEYACASATAALKTAILFNERLSSGTRASVTKAVQVIDPICSQENPPTLGSDARAALSSAVAALTSAAAEAQR